MKIVMTGATGTVGQKLTRTLLADGHRVLALSRDTENARLVLPADSDVAQWDAASDLDETLLTGADAVVHLAGAGVADRRWSKARKREIEMSRVGSADRLVEAISRMPVEQRPKTFLSASAIGIYGDRGEDELDESSDGSDGFLAEVCKAWEAAASRAVLQGCRVAIARIGIVLSPEGGMLGRLLPIFRLGLGGRLGRGRHWVSWVHVDDLVAMLARALRDEKIVGVFNAVSPHPVRNTEMTASIARAVGRPAWFPVPEFGVRLAVGEMASMLVASQRVRPHRMLEADFSFSYGELEDAIADVTSSGDRVCVFEQRVAKPLAEVFPFYADARNLEKMTPDFVRFRMLQYPDKGIHEGALISYKIALHGVPMFWRTRIDEWQPNQFFVDSQVCGPYSLWQHRHEFVDEGDATLVRDIVRYRLPLGALGELVAGSWVAHDVQRIFAFRRVVLDNLFGSTVSA
ncbi:MAG: hypothetical protein ACI8TX_002131 [Hyphomicrobiaceae bacterium]|jgi:uncharacterized protein (TIGR01777 family)